MASGEAEAILVKAQATAKGIDAVAKSIEQGKEYAQGAVSLSVAEKYVDAFGKLAKEGTSVVVPGNVGDIGQMIATAMSVYGTVGQSQAKTMAQRLAAPSPSQDGSAEQSSSETSHSGSTASKTQDVAASVLESFDKTQQRR